MFRNATRRLTTLACTLALLACVAGCSRRGLVLTETADSTASCEIYGDVKTVVDRATADRSPSTVHAGRFKAGLGVGTVAEGAPQGTALMLGDTVFVRPLDATSGGVVSSTDSIRASYMVGVPPRLNPSARYRVQGGGEGIALEEVFREIAGRHGMRVAVTGVGTMAYAESTSLVADDEAASDSGPAFGPIKREFDAKVVFFAVVLGDVSDYRGSNRRVFWVDPAHEAVADEIAMIHYGRIGSTEGVDPNLPGSAAGLVTDVGVLTPASRMKSGELAVYIIEDFDRR